MRPRKNPKRPSLMTINVFKNKSGLVLRYMLARPTEAVNGRIIQDDLGIGRAYANRILATLEALGFVSRDEEGLCQIQDPDNIIRQWKERYSPDFNDKIKIFCPKIAPKKVLAGIAKKTGYKVAIIDDKGPVLKAYIDIQGTENEYADIFAATKVSGGMRVEEGENLEVWVPFDNNVFFGEIGSGSVSKISRLQYLLDLFG